MSNADSPAFPARDVAGHWGLTKRELFAAILGAGLLGSPHIHEPNWTVARLACEYADALLAELDKPQEVDASAG